MLVEWLPVDHEDGPRLAVAAAALRRNTSSPTAAVAHTAALSAAMVQRTAAAQPDGVQPGSKYISLCYQYRCTGGQSASVMRKAEVAARADRFIEKLRNQSRAATAAATAAAAATAVDGGGDEDSLPASKGGGGGAGGAGWLESRCMYSRGFYSKLPNIYRRHGAAAAVYFKTPTGYLDLPGGVTLFSILLLLLTAGCMLTNLCCTYSHCKRYVHSTKRFTGHVL